jgi:hypothetical protein
VDGDVDDGGEVAAGGQHKEEQLVEMKGWESKRLMEAKEMMTNRFYALKSGETVEK